MQGIVTQPASSQLCSIPPQFLGKSGIICDISEQELISLSRVPHQVILILALVIRGQVPRHPSCRHFSVTRQNIEYGMDLSVTNTQCEHHSNINMRMSADISTLVILLSFVGVEGHPHSVFLHATSAIHHLTVHDDNTQHGV
ncbi:hypothetical protein TNCV_226321 [Trichonephila clavipes]|nr:hypothetical protein TNCV_226321 [Trichonephila clavipes]